MAFFYSSFEFQIVVKIFNFLLFNKSLDENRLLFHSSQNFRNLFQTKHEFFDSFGSHTQSLELCMCSIYIYYCNEPIVLLSSLFILKNVVMDQSNQEKNIRSTLPNKQKWVIVSKVVSIFLKSKEFFLV